MEKWHGQRMAIVCIKNISSPHRLHDKKEYIPRMITFSREKFCRVWRIAFSRPRKLGSRSLSFEDVYISVLDRRFKKHIFSNIGQKKKGWIQAYLSRDISGFVFCCKY